MVFFLSLLSCKIDKLSLNLKRFVILCIYVGIHQERRLVFWGVQCFKVTQTQLLTRNFMCHAMISSIINNTQTDLIGSRPLFVTASYACQTFNRWTSACKNICESPWNFLLICWIHWLVGTKNRTKYLISSTFFIYAYQQMYTMLRQVKRHSCIRYLSGSLHCKLVQLSWIFSWTLKTCNRHCWIKEQKSLPTKSSARFLRVLPANA